MKTKREMGFLSLVIAILVAIQLIPCGLTQVKAQGEQDLKVKVTFKEEGKEDKGVDLIFAPENVKDKTEKAILDLINASNEYKTQVGTYKEKTIELKLNEGQLTKVEQYVDGEKKTEYTIEATATVKAAPQEQDLKVKVTFKEEGKEDKGVDLIFAPENVKDKTEKAILDLINASNEYKTQVGTYKEKTIELKLNNGELTKVEQYVDGEKKTECSIEATATVKAIDLKPLKVKATITLPSKQKLTDIDITIPGADVKKQNVESFTKDQLKEFVVGTDAYEGAVKDYKEQIAKHKIDSFVISDDDLAKVNKYINKDKYQKPAEVSIEVVYGEKATEPSKNEESKETKKPKEDDRVGTCSRKYGSMAIGRRDGGSVKGIDFRIDVDVDALTQSIVRSKSIPLPQGDRFIGQLFQVTIKADGKTLTRKEMSKVYDINLDLKTFEKARKNNLTVYGRSDEDEKWERINRFGYNKDGTLSIEGIDTYTEFVVWLDQDKNDRKLQFAGAMNAKDPGNRQGFTPRVLAPYNPQVAGAVNSNPNAYLPTTGEGNFAGWVAASLVLAALALVTKKIMK